MAPNHNNFYKAFSQYKSMLKEVFLNLKLVGLWERPEIGICSYFQVDDLSHFYPEGVHEDSPFSVHGAYVTCAVDNLLNVCGFPVEDFTRLSDLGTKYNQVNLEKKVVHDRDIFDVSKEHGESIFGRSKTFEQPATLKSGEELEVYSEPAGWSYFSDTVAGFYQRGVSDLKINHYFFNSKGLSLGYAGTNVRFDMNTGKAGVASKSIMSFDQLRTVFDSKDPVALLNETADVRREEIETEYGGFVPIAGFNVAVFHESMMKYNAVPVAVWTPVGSE